MKHVVGLKDFTLMLQGTVMNCVFPSYFNIHTFGLIVAALQVTNHITSQCSHTYIPSLRCAAKLVVSILARSNYGLHRYE